jgi:TRAP-type C4-dicarboxylate transport system permease small subunit
MLAIILGFSLAQILDRYLLKTEFDAWNQIERIAMVWAALIGAAIAFRERRNLVIELIDSMLPPVVRKVRDVACHLVLLGLAVLLFVKSLRVVEVGLQQDIVGTPFTYAVDYAALSLSLGLFILFLLLRLMRPHARIPEDMFESNPNEKAP